MRDRIPKMRRGVAAGASLVVAGIAALVLPVLLPEMVCWSSPTGDRVCETTTFGLSAFPTQYAAVDLWQVMIGPILLAAGIALIHAVSRRTPVTAGLLIATGLAALVVAPLAHSSVEHVGPMDIEVSIIGDAAIILNIFGLLVLLLGTILTLFGGRSLRPVEATR